MNLGIVGTSDITWSRFTVTAVYTSGLAHMKKEPAILYMV
jgi:hypothetical protein